MQIYDSLRRNVQNFFVWHGFGNSEFCNTSLVIIIHDFTDMNTFNDCQQRRVQVEEVGCSGGGGLSDGG